MKPTSLKRAGVAERLRAALLEVQDSLTGGKPLTARMVSVKEPGKWGSVAVKKIRADLKLSQAPFARLLGVSSVLVEHWEQGLATPRGPARRLLDEIARDPAGYLDRYVMHRRAG